MSWKPYFCVLTDGERETPSHDEVLVRVEDARR